MSSELLDEKDDTLNDVHDGDQSVYFVFMGYGHSEEDQPGFVEDIQMLLRDDDLLMFNEIVAEEQLTDNNVALTL
ncbi:hypothetical protein GN958_ATG14840 [Phytophthora infestans]|uniref:Uncharacterized protein n=1 Tax=Phytophthora infestans TaxID=4787 RepID=A0A8S9UCE4_PHYIN|nr:hypothetical protein GN958_ATG14840 [Phytophthora infestans]